MLEFGSHVLCKNYTIDKSVDVWVVKVRREIWQQNGLLLLNAIMVGVMVGVGAYAPRYRRHPVIGPLFTGATTLFLPIISYVASTVGSTQILMDAFLSNLKGEFLQCTQHTHTILIFLWTGLAVIIGIISTVVVASDAREGRSIAPPILLPIKAIWTVYLTFSTIGRIVIYWPVVSAIYGQLFVIMFTKLAFKYYTFYKARKSLAFGCSPRLVAGYMVQPEVGDEHAVLPAPPALVVMGEDSVQIEKEPYGYSFKTRPNSSNRLVTLDRVWGLEYSDMQLQRLRSTQTKDLCFSFALFKLLRCRFAKYTVVGAAGFIKAHRFFRDTLLKGAADYERIFGIIEDELSFIHDYYYSSLPIYYYHHLLAVLSILLSLYSIGYCIFLISVLASVHPGPEGDFIRHPQVYCWQVQCTLLSVGDLNFDIVPTFLVIAVVLLAEIRDIVSYICSNWTKVALICHYVNQATWQQSPAVGKCIGLVFKYCKCRLVSSWDDKMKQCSILALYPRKTQLLGLQHLLCLRGPNKKKVKVQSSVKAAIFEALKGESLTCDQDGGLKHIRPPSPPIAVASDDGKQLRPAYTILAWHVATSILQVAGHPQPSDPDQEGHKTAAIRLSRYCAYLVACCPELLPDDDEWCKSLYGAVEKDAKRVLSAATGADQSQRLVHLLGAERNHGVLRDGAALGQQLVDSMTGWEALARFWSEMLLYVAPSENMEGHADAIARGGELITLLWALLAHAGIVDRLGADATTGDASGA